MASTTRPRPNTVAARKRAAPKPAEPTIGDLDFEPIRIAADEEIDEERVTLFFIGDTEYTIPKNVPAGAALEFLRIAKVHGQEVGAGALLTRVLGEEAYQALEQSRGLTDGQLNQIVDLVMDLALGRKEKPGKAR
jgi:hypothetical protein